MQDTFFIDPTTILRSHTSNVQVHLMENEDPPIRYIVPGRVYRNEAISARSHCFFHQIEGLCVDKNISFESFVKNLKKVKSDFFLSYKNNNLYKSYTEEEIITIGSLLEKEGLNFDDKKTISSVIFNRLIKNMNLYEKSNTYDEWYWKNRK